MRDSSTPGRKSSRSPSASSSRSHATAGNVRDLRRRLSRRLARPTDPLAARRRGDRLDWNILSTVALDSHLLPPRKSRDSDEGVGGESWEIHGGGFYRIHKFRVAPETIPEPLHCAAWEAYTTWLSGFALLVVLYYLEADSYLVDPPWSETRHGTA